MPLFERDNGQEAIMDGDSGLLEQRQQALDVAAAVSRYTAPHLPMG